MLLSVALPFFAADVPSSFDVRDLAWMAGDWQSERGQAHIEEHWTQPAGGTLLGMSRTVAGDKTVEFEFLRIEKRPEGVFYVAQPGGRPPTDFKLVAVEQRRAVFENLQHDFPQRISYQKKADGTLVARIEGDVGGKVKAIEFPYRAMR